MADDNEKLTVIVPADRIDNRALLPILASNGVSICVMNRTFRGKITRKIRDFFIKARIFWVILPRKNSGHDAD